MPDERGRDAEVIVVGGGPAGSTLAAALAEVGRDVLLLDKARFPRHKPCSDYVNPAGAELLTEMGVFEEALRLGARRMDGMIVHAPNGAQFTAHYGRAEPGRAALGLSRYRLDLLLLQRARAAGVTVREGAHVRDLLWEGGRVIGVIATIDGSRELLRSSIVIGADGRHSAVARALGMTASLHWPRKTGLAAHYRGVARRGGYGEMFVGSRTYAGLALLEDDLTNVTIVADTSDVAQRPGSIDQFFADAIAELPTMARVLTGAERVGTIRGVGPMACRARRTAGAGWLLVGDAASFLDPFPGEGIEQAMRSAMLAAPVIGAALATGDCSAAALAPYQRARRRAFTAKRQVSWIVQAFVNVPPLMNYVTPRLERRDELGLTLTGVLGGFQPASRALDTRFLARLLRP